jgi:hypothetical protein
MSLLLLLLAGGGAASAASAAAPPPCATCRGPAFSWDTVPKFIHTSNATGPVNAGALALMARFPMVTVEKFQGACGNEKTSSPACDQEARIIEVLKGVKQINPNVSAIFYYNSVLDFNQYRLHALMEADPSLMLHDSAGQIIRMGGGHKTSDVFDFSNPATRSLFIEECVNATKSGFVDGCFCDRAVDGTPSDSGDDTVPCGSPGGRKKNKKPCSQNMTAAKAAAYAAGHVQVLTELQAAIGEGPVIANHACASMSTARHHLMHAYYSLFITSFPRPCTLKPAAARCPCMRWPAAAADLLLCMGAMALLHTCVVRRDLSTALCRRPAA